MSNTLAVKIERVFQSYRDTHDIDVSMLLCAVYDPAEQQTVRTNTLLIMRCQIELAKYKALLNGRIETLAKSSISDSVRFGAVKLLAQAHYPERFKEKIEVSGELSYTIKPRQKALLSPVGRAGCSKPENVKVQRWKSSKHKSSIKASDAKQRKQA